jgi:protein-disulfide isomerase
MLRLSRILACLGLVALMAGPATAAEFNDNQKSEIEGIVRDYLIAHPEILREMSDLLQAKEQAAEDEARKVAVKENAQTIFRDEGDVVVGNPNGKVTLVEFFDYNCGWCKKSVDEVSNLVSKDPELRVVLKEFPIFGEDSEYAARAALAAAKQGKYWDFHIAMFKNEGKVTASSVDEIAAAKGIDVAKMKADMEDPAIAAQLEKNHTLAQALTISGTPAFIVEDIVVPGYVPIAGLEAAVKDVRDRNACVAC